MDWTRAVDGYCERMDPGFWAEPLNALSNLAFLIAALIMWQRCAGLVAARVLCGLLFAIGIGSFLFHTYAQVWAGVADVAPIALFVLTYIWLANRAYLGLGGWQAGLGVLAFFPFAALTVPVFQLVPVLGVSAGYLPVALLIALYGIGLRRRLPQVARGLGIGAAVLLMSITLRSLDMPSCANLPMGTHLWWHLLNGLMLGWMIEVYRRHCLASA